MTTPDPKSPSGGGLPSRHRPVLDNLAKDTLEEELWALDDDDLRLEEDGPVAPPVSTVPVAGRSSFHVPPRRDAAGVKAVPPAGGSDPKADEPPAAKASGGVVMNIGKVGQVRRSEAKTIEPSRLESAFDELDAWDDAPVDEPVPVAERTSIARHEPSAVQSESLESPEVADAGPGEAPAHAADAPVDDSGMDEFSPPIRTSAEPVSLRPHMRLNGVERIGLVVLAVGLLVCGVLVYTFSIQRLPTHSPYAQDVDFPVKGSILTVKGATSYWRPPVAEGPDREIVRRGTIYIPVVEVTTTAGTGAIRAVFRDQDRKSVGDMVTVAAGAPGLLRLAGTAGFEETGTHAAYRAGGQKPWTVEILEAPSVDSPSADFKRLFQMNLSTETR